MNDALNQLGLHKYCCRKILMCHVNTIDTALKYSDPVPDPRELSIPVYAEPAKANHLKTTHGADDSDVAALDALFSKMAI